MRPGEAQETTALGNLLITETSLLPTSDQLPQPKACALERELQLWPLSPPGNICVSLLLHLDATPSPEPRPYVPSELLLLVLPSVDSRLPCRVTLLLISTAMPVSVLLRMLLRSFLGPPSARGTWATWAERCPSAHLQGMGAQCLHPAPLCILWG